MTGEENYIEHALHVGEELTGLTLEQLGFEPRLEDLTEAQRNRLDADDLEWITFHHAGAARPEPLPGKAPGRRPLGGLGRPDRPAL
jgi:hypothetical protein